MSSLSASRTVIYLAGPYQWVPEHPAGPHHARPHEQAGVLDFRPHEQQATAGQTHGACLFSLPDDVPVPSGYVEIDKGDCRDIKVTGRHRQLIRKEFGVQADGETLADLILDALMRGDPTGEVSAPPAMPAHNRQVDVLLQGHGTPIATLPVSMGGRHWSAIRDRVRHGFVEARESGMPDAILSKVLGHTTRKFFGRWDSEQHTQFHTRGRVDLRPRRPETSLAEDFNAATGFGNVYSWTMTAEGDWVNSSNKAKRTGAYGSPYYREGCRCDTPVSSDDHICGVFVDTLYGDPENQQLGPWCRHRSSDFTYGYIFRAIEASGVLRTNITKFVGGTVSDIATGSFYNNVELWVEADGSSIYGKTGVAKTQRASATDTSVSGASYVYGGMWGSSNVDIVTGYKWSLADLVVAFGGRNQLIGGGIF